MTIRYKCAACGAALNIDDELAGSEGNCPRCQVQFTVPASVSDAAPQPAVEVTQGSKTLPPGGQVGDGALSDDDISALLNSDAPPSGSSSRRGSQADSDAELQTVPGNPFDEEPRRENKKRAVDADAQEEPHDEESERPSQKQKKKRTGTPPAKGDSRESSSIAKTLMGRGGQPLERDETEKRKRRPFGGRDEHHEGEITSIKDVVTYAAKMGWPFLLGIAVVFGGLFWLSYSMMKRMDLPPLAVVSGTVTLDGKPLKAAIVKFIPRFEGPEAYKRGSSSFGFTDADGKYALTYANEDGKPIMGAVIGPHQVQIQLNDLGGGQLIPSIYSTSQSELKADVKKGMGPVDFSLKSEPAESVENLPE
jgi:hypothetical protein